MSNLRKPRILYVVYWGALEPLGQSLVVPAVKELSQLGAEITLVTFEKPQDFAKDEEVTRMNALLSEDQIEWIPLQYHQTPKILSTLFDFSHGIARALQKRLTKRFDILHARTFPGGLIGLLLAPLIGAKLVYHNEGFYPDEQVDSGVWSKGSRAHRIAKYLENLIYSRAQGIFALSEKSKVIIEKLPGVRQKKTPVIVVPSCVDLKKFKLLKPNQDDFKGGVKFVYVGSVGGRYRLDNIGRFVQAARKLDENACLQIYSKAEYDLVKDILSRSNLPEKSWSLKALTNAEIPAALSEHHAGLHFLQTGISEHTGSPTKIGEYWAVGLPIVITSNMSDNDTVAKRENVGIVVEEQSEESYLKAFRDLREMLADPEISVRCRHAAETHYALAQFCKEQFNLYKTLIY